MYEKVKEPIREGACMIEQETEEEKAHERNMKSMREDCRYGCAEQCSFVGFL